MHTQSGAMIYEPEFYKIKSICQKTIDFLEPITGNKSITIKNYIDEELTVYSGKNMLQTIIRNLLSNAIKFTNSGGEISLNASSQDEVITLSVKDNGKGISIEKLKTLFKNLPNKSTEGTSNELGTGLGLTICKKLVEKQGGTIWVESEPGKGSTFYFTIPRQNN